MKFPIIYADPPWPFRSRELQTYRGRRFRPLTAVYPIMTMLELKALPIETVRAPDCALFLWAQSALLPDALDLITAWGFTYRTVAFVWQKLSKNGKQLATVGSWTMANTELCLLGTCGTMRQYKQKDNIQQLVAAERTVHSRKPAEIRQRIEKLFSCTPRLELFARQRVPGWYAWGNEIT